MGKGALLEGQGPGAHESLEEGVVSVTDGPSYLEMGHTKVKCVVTGPHEVVNVFHRGIWAARGRGMGSWIWGS